MVDDTNIDKKKKHKKLCSMEEAKNGRQGCGRDNRLSLYQTSKLKVPEKPEDTMATLRCFAAAQ